MLSKKITALAALVLFTVTAMAQQRPADLTVCKPVTGDGDACMFTTIQAAVNAARPGQIIEIQDNAIYDEQVTIDGRDESPWAGVTGGKNGITIRSRNPTSINKPTIRWHDTQNTSPRNFAEAQCSGELPTGRGNPPHMVGGVNRCANNIGGAGNYETNGALRILRAQGVTIDGIIVDGGGRAPFGWDAIWESRFPLFHANAAITIVVSGGTIVRNCEMRNAYFGVNFKDRNTGGVFGNPNPGDNDFTVPLSEFGRVGNHLIEYNRIHTNSVAFFSESAWDLGSTIRYNLIYDNFHTPATQTEITRIGIEAANQVAGAFLFKDHVFTPFAIYNNTLFNNSANFLANWKVGTPHLIFNNIYSKPNGTGGGSMVIDHLFPFRMNNCLFSAASLGAPSRQRVEGCWHTNTWTVWEDMPRYHYLSVHYSFSALQATPGTVTCPPPFTQGGLTATAENIWPGTHLTSTQITSAANLRWLETVATPAAGNEDLFVSTSPLSPDFLRPKWDHPLVEQFIKNKGWEAAGVRNSDGQIADIGAIPSTGRAPATVARIRPSNVVLIDGRNATASFYITLDQGQLNDPSIKFLRWVSPLPIVADSWGDNAPLVPRTSVVDIPPPAVTNLRVGANNTMTFTIPQLPAGADQTYGFFEMIIEGTDANGNDVTTDVGFLPYRTLTNFLDIEVVRGTERLTEVRAGDTVTLTVRSRGTGAGAVAVGQDISATYDLLSDAAAFMYCVGSVCPTGQRGNPVTGDNPLVSDDRVIAGQARYDVVFTRAGEEVIMGAGLWVDGTRRVSFLGARDIRVLPGVPENIVFVAPIPKAQLPAGVLPQVINRGADFEVLLEVQDRFGNAVDQAVNVSIVSATPTVGDVGTPGTFNAAAGGFATRTAQTSPATGIATFTARVTNGVPTQTFDMTATITVAGGTRNDVGALRIGRVLDRLEVFYADTVGAGATNRWQNYQDMNVSIFGRVGDWFQVTVKAVAPDTVIDSKNGCILVEPSNPNIILSSTSGGAPENTFTMTNGSATFWIGANPGMSMDISNACLDIEMMMPGCTTPDHGIMGGNRCDISFTRPTSNINNAVVYGDGDGRPDSVYVRFQLDGQSFTGPDAVGLPDSVMLMWPPNSPNPISITVRRSQPGAITAVDSTTIRANFSGLRNTAGIPFPMGYTEIIGLGLGLVTVYGGLGSPGTVADLFEVLDGIGPLIADTSGQIPGRWNPMIVERLPTSPAGTLDTLIIQLTEEMFNDISLPMPLVGQNSLLYTTDPDPNSNPAIIGTRLNIQSAFLGDINSREYRVVLVPGTPVPAEGDWIRLNTAAGITDVAAVPRFGHPNNPVHPNNRWARVELKPVPPEIIDAYYTSDNTTGRLNYAYITFNKVPNVYSWFTNGHFRFVLSGVGTDSVAIGADQFRFLEWVDNDMMSIRIDLSAAFPSSRDTVFTGGSGMSVTIGFNPILDFPPITTIVTDKAAPVLVREVVLKIGTTGETADRDAPDTMVVIYSERIEEDVLQGIAQPVIISGRDPVNLRFVAASIIPGTTYMEVTYITEPNIPPDRFPSNGDLVYIDPVAGIFDASPGANMQNASDNRRVPLRVVRNLSWAVTVTNNPFRSGSGSANASTITVSPNARGANVEVTAQIRIYNNMGNIVIDTTLNRVPNAAVLIWDGHNRAGRMVGTGTYLLRISGSAVVVGTDGEREPPQRHTEARSIGFVRGRR
jgi:hypothetical protein